MAAQKQKKQKPTEFQQQLMEMKQKREREQMIAQRKEHIENNRNRLDEHMRNAIDKYIEYSEKDPDSLITRFQLMTISLIQPLNEVIETVFALEETMSIIDEALTIVEDTMSLIDSVLSPKTHKKVGIFGRWKTKMRMKRYMKVWQGRISQLGVIMKEMSNGTKEITSSISKMVGSMSNTKGDLMSSGMDAKTMKLINDRKRERGIEATDAGDINTGSTGSTGNAGGVSGKGGFDENAPPPSLDGLI